MLLRLGIQAVLAAFAGAWLLLQITDIKPIFIYQVGERTFEVYPLKFIIAILLIMFALLDLIPYFNKLQFGKGKLPIGGVLSDFLADYQVSRGLCEVPF